MEGQIAQKKSSRPYLYRKTGNTTQVYRYKYPAGPDNEDSKFFILIY